MNFLSLFTVLIYTLESDCAKVVQKVFPIKYDLTITPHFETELKSSFEARLVFTFKPLHHSKDQTIELHAHNLDIASLVLLENSGNVTTKLEASVYNDSIQQLISVDAGYPLSVDKTYQLHVNYSGKISNDGWGLYKGFYEHKGNKSFYTVTQLRPIFARRLLPCLDEPSYKARFTLRIWRLPQYTALSNMPLVHTSTKSPKSDRVLDTFAESPPMSTFLLALAVFEFSSLTSHGGHFSSWSVPSKIHLVEHGHKMIPSIVRSMESIIGSKFPMPKIDQIALPVLNPVAMENWGMNTYREVFILYKEGEFAPRVRQDVPRFIAHEVSHHWLGNLVTLEWWGWLWLSEMYAMYYEYYLPSQVNPLWQMADQMVVDLVMPGLLQDSFNNSKPLTSSVSTNQEILDKFSGLTYTKGPALVRMINSFITIPKAEKALRNLLLKKKFGTVNPTQLWKFYNEVAEGLPTDMESIMKTWTDESGYPLVTVRVNQSDGVITLKQERFLVDGSVEGKALTQWWVPLSLTTGTRPDFDSTQPKLWLQPGVPLTVLRLGHSIQSWVLVNLQQVGFFRVNYDQQNWNRLINSLRSKPATIHELSRGQLLDDSFSLARAGRLSYSVPLGLASYLTGEACYFPWAAFIPHINFILMRVNGHPVFDVFSGYISQLIGPVYDAVGFHLNKKDSHLTQLQRVQIVTLACSLGLYSCVMAARNHENIISQGKPSQVPPGLETVQLCTFLEAGFPENKKLHQLSLWSREDQMKVIPCIGNKTTLTKYLTKSLQEDSAADWRVKLSAALSRLANIDSVFSTLLNNHQTLIDRFEDTSFAEYLTLVGKQLSTRDQLGKLNGLQGKKTSSIILSALRSISNELTERLKWVEVMAPTIQSWSVAYGKNLTRKFQSSMVFCKQLFKKIWDFGTGWPRIKDK